MARGKIRLSDIEDYAGAEPPPADSGGGATDEAIDPASLTNEPTEPIKKERKKRGPNKAKPVNAEGLEAMLLSIHMTLATILKAPELELDTMEAKNLASCGANVARHYQIPAASQQFMDWCYLIVAIILIYRPKFAAMKSRRVAPSTSSGQATKATPIDGVSVSN